MRFLLFALSLALIGCPGTDPPAPGAPCGRSTDCAGGQQCWRGACRAACTAAPECGGAACEGGLCIGPECASDAECGVGRRCGSGLCISGLDGGTLLGRDAPCTAGSQCESGICLPAAQGGVCTIACVDSMACGDAAKLCAPVRVSRGIDAALDAVVNACVPAHSTGAGVGGACATDAECTTLACFQGQCAVSCDEDTDCLLGQTCRGVPYDFATGVKMCWYPDVTQVETRSIILDAVTVMAGAPSEGRFFAVPPATVGLVVNAIQNETSTAQILVSDFVSPRNEQLFALSMVASNVDPPLRWVPTGRERSLALLHPNTTTDRLAVLGGRYRINYSVGGGAAGSTSVGGVVFYKVSPTPVSSGTLALNVFPVGVGVTAAAAPSDPRIQGMLTEYRRILLQGGVTVGDVSYFDIPEPQASAFSVIDSVAGTESEMLQLFKAGQAAPPGALNLFLVRQIASAAGGNGIFVGGTGSIPAPINQGAWNNGVVAAFDPAVVGADPAGQIVAAQIAAHESGHYLGLFHTREQGSPCAAGSFPTPTNPCALFGGGDVLLDTDPNDTSNLMFFTIPEAGQSGVGTTLSAGQGYVLTRHPLVR